MAEFLNTSKAYAEIEGIVNKTESELVLISPFIKVPEPLLERLKYVDEKGVKIVVVCREKALKDEVRSALKQLKHLELRFDENLHAKCFYNEESMVIGSLNLYEYSQQHNREMGILLSLKDDHNVFNEARNEAEFIVNNAKKAESVANSLVQEEPKGGFCIRCGEPIPYNLSRPYCRRCGSQWKAKGGNPDYRERDGKCHTCGKRASTSKAMPQCNSC